MVINHPNQFRESGQSHFPFKNPIKNPNRHGIFRSALCFLCCSGSYFNSRHLSHCAEFLRSLRFLGVVFSAWYCWTSGRHYHSLFSVFSALRVYKELGWSSSKFLVCSNDTGLKYIVTWFFVSLLRFWGNFQNQVTSAILTS